jgi:hypothetical protein
VNAKKSMLAPEIKKLRTLRNRFTEIESEYTERKRAYDAA